MKAVTSKQMRELDRAAIEDLHIPSLVLMENAGRGAAEILMSTLKGVASPAVLVLCGPGNNGGDGYVLARHCANAGGRVFVASTVPASALTGDCARNRAAAEAMGVPVRLVSDPAGAVALFSSMGHLDAVVDALLGTGSRPGLDPVMAALVEQANQRLTFRLAVDLPTGVDADTGTVTGPAFMAHATATCGLPKIGMYLFPGYECCGAIHVVDISMPRQLLAGAAGVTLLGSPGTVPAMPPRPANVHKNRMGHVLVIAGSPGKAGAAVLVGRAALRTGAGLCTLACHSGCRANLEGLVPDLMVEGLTMDSRPDEEMSAMVRGKNAIVVGPGLGTCNEARDLFQWAFASSQLPVVGDADIFTAFAGDMGRMKRPGPWPTIITPHPGEMSRLTGMTVEAVQKDRIPVAQRVACELGMTVVLKGAHSVIASPDGRTALSVNGTPALAKAGSGDVLAGVLGALLGMGLPAHEAACLGVYLHARSGELAAARLGVHGVMASDLVETVPAAAKEIS